MAYATDADLLARVPEATSVTSDQRQTALDDAAAMIDDALFGAKAVPAHAYLAAHLLAAGGLLAGEGGAAGPVASMSAGAISVSYAVATPPSVENPSSSKWGRLYLMYTSATPYQPEFA